MFIDINDLIFLEIQIGGGQDIWVQGKKVIYLVITLLARVQLKAKSKSYQMKLDFKTILKMNFNTKN